VSLSKLRLRILFLILAGALTVSGCRTTGEDPSGGGPGGGVGGGGGGGGTGPTLTVTRTTPSNLASGVDVYTTVSITFGQDIDPNSVTTSSFRTGTLTGTTTVNGNVITFTPTSPSPLPESATYQIQLAAGSSGIAGLDGSHLASDYSFSFTTLATTDCSDVNVLCVDDTAGPQQEYSTIQSAVSVAQAGQTVLVHNGNYAGFVASRSGTSTNRITIRANGNAVVIDQAEPGGSGNSILVNGKSYVTIDGFIVERGGASGYGLAARNASATSPMRGLVISNNVVRNSASTNLYLSQVADSLVEGNETSGSMTSHGIYLANGGSDNTTLRGNRSFNNAKNGIHLNGDASVGGDGLHTGIIIENNVLYDNTGNGMDLDGMQDSTVQNNLVYGNGRHSLRVFQIDAAAGPKNLRIINNTFVSGNGWAMKLSEDGGGHVIFNNILFSTSSSLGAICVGNTSFSSDRNAVTGRFSVNNEASVIDLSQWQALGHGANSFTSNSGSLFTNASGGQYTLMGGVPAIDAGMASFQAVSAPGQDIDGQPRPQGSAYDLGAYEHL